MRIMNMKFKVPDFSFYDKDGIQRYLEKQAEKGWVLDMIVWDIWRFRKDEPKKLRCAVTYFPKSSWFGPEPTAEIEEFNEFCARTGWEFAASNSQMQVYYNENENPLPIETDPEIELKNIHDSVMGWYMGSLFLAAFFSGIALSFPLTKLFKHPQLVLGNPERLIIMLLWASLFLLCVVEIANYFRWWEKATTAAEHGQGLIETKGHRKFSKAILVFSLILLAAYHVVLSATDKEALEGIIRSAAYVVMYFAIIAFAHYVSRFLQKKHAPKPVNLIITFVIAWILIMIFAMPLL